MEITEEIDYEALPATATMQAQLLAGAFAGIMEHSVMYPIDAIKTRMQAFSTGKTMYSGVISTITKISSQEGSMALFKGINSMILGAGPAHAVYFATYEFVKREIMEEDEISPLKSALSGASATIAADALMNPFDTIKQRLQLGGESKTMWHTAKKMYLKEGFTTFYASYPTTISMNIPFAALNFAIYETSTKLLNPNNNYDPIIHCLCGGLSGAIGAAVTNPLDCVKTLLQVRGESSNEQIKKSNTFWKASKTIYQMYGYKGFLRGMKPRVIANVPATAISWTSYEMAKHFLID
ncbi:hypothetical protein WICPIJ_003374 [Wickerhamomyces pijperi]|uniref:Uncharacterized protein n=1 Tax=Wickerhamomyces pijperi TaxID=599730 RepID=A0A9P8Q7W3_WICPI|nr:hypothetical protein WICPIJ_003374 [Wickerhamomyces pijperi]